MIRRKLGDVSLRDLEAIIANGVHESQQLEFKAEIPNASDAARKEFLKDVSAFANAQGGDVVFGIVEDRKSGSPSALRPVLDPSQAGGAAAVIERLRSILATGITPRLHGVDFHPVHVDASGSVLVMRVPQSWTRPHGYLMGPETRFSMRHGNITQPMTVDELRDAFLGSTESSARLSQEVDDRLRAIASPESRVHGGRPYVAVHLLPLDSASSRHRLELRTIKRSNYLRPLPCRYPGIARFGTDGLLSTADGNRGRTDSYVLVGWTGIIEAVNELDMPREALLVGDMIEQDINTACLWYSRLLADLSVRAPVLACCSLVNVKGMRVRRDGIAYDAGEPIDRAIVRLPEIVIEDLEVLEPAVKRPMLDAIWQASGIDGSPFFSADGTYSGFMVGIQ